MLFSFAEEFLQDGLNLFLAVIYDCDGVAVMDTSDHSREP